MNKLNKNIKTLIIYAVISVILTVLSCIGIFFRIWEPAAVFGLSFLIIFPVLYMNLYSFRRPTAEGLKASSIVMLSLGRIFFLVINVVVSGILLKFTTGIGDKYRMLYILLTFVPVLVALVLFYFNSKENGETGLNKALEDTVIDIEVEEEDK